MRVIYSPTLSYAVCGISGRVYGKLSTQLYFHESSKSFPVSWTFYCYCTYHFTVHHCKATQMFSCIQLIMTTSTSNRQVEVTRISQVDSESGRWIKEITIVPNGSFQLTSSRIDYWELNVGFPKPRNFADLSVRKAICYVRKLFHMGRSRALTLI